LIDCRENHEQDDIGDILHPLVMLVESIQLRLRQKALKEIQLRPLKNASIETAMCGLGIEIVIAHYCLLAPVMRPLLFVLFVVASFAAAL